MAAFRIVVVDDSALFRTLMRNVCADIPDCEVVASAPDGKSAIEKIRELQPDVVTLDVEMPDMNGIEVLRELKRQRIGAKVVMISRYTTAGAQVTTDALIEGAFDFILKPSGGNPAENKATLRTALEERIAALRGESSDIESESSLPTPSARRRTSAGEFAAVVIGCSTGGPDALARVIPDLPADLPVPVFIVQHMPEGFTASLAARLDEASELEVFEAADGQIARAGQVVLARGGRHLQFSRSSGGGIQVHLTQDPPEHRCRPAVDYTLRSAVEICDQKLLAVILTGMGRDGTDGCRLVRDHGGHVIAQDAEGCTVYGMPKSVTRAGIVDEVVKLPRIAATICRILHGRS